MVKIPKEKEETDVSPVQDAENDKRTDEEDELGHAPVATSPVYMIRFSVARLFHMGV